MNLPGKRLLLGTAVAVAALVVDGGTTVSPDGETSAAPQGRGGAAQDGRDCPDKAGGTEGAQPSQPSQPAQPEQQPDVAGNA